MADISNIWVYSWHFLKLCFINNSKKSVYLFVCVYVWNKRFNVMLFKKRKITKNKKKTLAKCKKMQVFVNIRLYI